MVGGKERVAPGELCSSILITVTARVDSAIAFTACCCNIIHGVELWFDVGKLSRLPPKTQQ